MAVRLTKAWSPIQRDRRGGFPGHLGVFELADESQRVLFIGRADARSLFGLRSELEAAFATIPTACFFRYEVTTAYHTRHLELLMVHVADHGSVPPINAERGVPPLGRLCPG